MVHTAGGINKTFPIVLKNSFGGKMTHQLWFVFPFVESFDIFLLEFQLSQKVTQRIRSIIILRSALTKKCGIHQRCHPFKPALVTTTLSCILWLLFVCSADTCIFSIVQVTTVQQIVLQIHFHQLRTARSQVQILMNSLKILVLRNWLHWVELMLLVLL